MKSFVKLFTFCVLAWSTLALCAQSYVSIQKYGVLPNNSPHQNKENLQKAIDELSPKGGALFVEPVENGYPMEGGLVLRRNVSLLGVHGPTGRGTAGPERKGPTGSLFVITDRERSFISVESATQIKGIQFWYPEQTFSDSNRIIAYKPTINMVKAKMVEGVTLKDLSFYGEYQAFDFEAPVGSACEQILFEHCYGYPLSGRFIAIDRCYDIPRILHCHVNPANMREFGRSFSRNVIDAVTAKRSYAYAIDHTDNAQLMDLFTFGTFGGIFLGPETYGQLTNFNFDCVSIGIFKTGTNAKNRNWQISQGSIIANVATNGRSEVHPIVVEGRGHTAICNVEAFSGLNNALTTCGVSHDYICVRGNEPLTVTLLGCRMQGYTVDNPITILNPNAKLRAVACIDKEENFFDK